MVRLYCLMLIGSVLMSASYAPLENSDEDHGFFLSKFYEKHHIAESDVVFKAIQGKKAVIVALKKAQDDSQKEVGRLLCFYIKNIEGFWLRYNKNSIIFERCMQEYYGHTTPSLYCSVENRCTSIMGSYTPSKLERLSAFEPDIHVKEQGELYQLSLGRGVITELSTGKERRYESVLNIYVCPYAENLEVMFERWCVGAESRVLERAVLCGREVLGIPKSMPRLANDKEQAKDSFSDVFFGLEGARDCVVRVYDVLKMLGPYHYNCVKILRILEGGVEREECVIKQHKIGEGVGQILVYSHDELVSAFSYLCWWGQFDVSQEDGAVRIGLNGTVRTRARLQVELEYFLKISYGKDHVLISQATKSSPEPSILGYEVVNSENISLYPKPGKKHFESKFLDLKAPLETLLGYPYDREKKKKK